MAVFGEEFRKGATLLIILAIAQFINVATGSVGQILIMSGNEAKLQRAFMITAMASLSVSYFFIQEFGALGAAFSTAFGVVTVNLLAAYFVFRYVKIGLFL
jgi:O-antigen/teichoic acid export membrane protein